MSEQDSDDALDAAYRRASAADAGRVGAAVRARILAEGEAAARRNLPAANQSRYWMGAVAGVAVLGFAVLMLRQVDMRLPGDAERTVTVSPVTDVAPSNAMRAEVSEDAAAERAAVKMEMPPAAANTEPAGGSIEERIVAAPVLAPLPPPVESTAQQDRGGGARDEPRLQSREAANAAQASRAFQAAQSADVAPQATRPAAPVPSARAPAPAGAVAAPVAPDAEAERGLEQVQVTGSRIRSSEPSNAPVATLSEKAVPAPTALRLLQDHFPAQYQSTRTHRLWLVRDTQSGEVLRLGEFAARTNWESERAGIEPLLRDRRIVSTRTESVRNLRGQLIELTIAEAR